MNWTEILLKGRYPLFLLYSVIDGEVANFVGSTLVGNGIFNIFLIYTLSVFMNGVYMSEVSQTYVFRSFSLVSHLSNTVS